MNVFYSLEGMKMQNTLDISSDSENFKIDKFLKYLKNPYYKNSNNYGFFSNIAYLLQSFVYCLISVALVGLFLLAIDHLIVHYTGINSIYKQIKDSNNNIKKHFGEYSFFFVIIIGPIIEEIIFRFPLNCQKASLALAISILVFRFSGNSLTHVNYFNKFYWISVVYSLGLFVLLNFLLPNSFFKKIKSNYFNWWYYFFAISFGLVHISNIKNINPYIFFIYPLFVAPQIIMGFFIGNIRMQRGFLWGIALHGLINTTSFVLK